MIRNLSKKVCEKATPANVILTLLGSFILQYILVAVLLPVFMEYSEGLKNPDQILGYNTKTIVELFEQLGDVGRKFYIRMLWVDNLYTISTGVGFSLLLGLLVKKSRRYVILPLAFTLFDLMENILQMSLLNMYPVLSSLMIKLASFSTMLKFSFGGMSILLLLFVLIQKIPGKIKNN